MNTARTKHLDSLFDHDGLTAGCKAMTHEVGDSAPGGRASGRVFAVVEMHPCMPVCTRACLGTRDAVKEFCVAALEISASRMLRDPKTRCDLERLERHNAEGHPGGDGLRRKARVEIVDGERERSRKSAAIVNISKGRVVLPHSPEDTVLALLGWSKAHGDGTNAKVECDLLRTFEFEVVP